MGIFSRLGSLIKSNINDLISRAEDPEKKPNQDPPDKKNRPGEGEEQGGGGNGEEKALEKQDQGEQEKIKDWERKAMLAVRAGDVSLAKEALVRKQEHET